MFFTLEFFVILATSVFIKSGIEKRIQNGDWDTDADSVSSVNQQPC
jgi:hypothetical protein